MVDLESALVVGWLLLSLMVLELNGTWQSDGGDDDVERAFHMIHQHHVHCDCVRVCVCV